MLDHNDRVALLIAAVAALPPTLAAIVAWYAARQSNKTSLGNSKKLESIHLQMNGRLDELIKSSIELAYSEGFEKGKGNK